MQIDYSLFFDEGDPSQAVNGYWVMPAMVSLGNVQDFTDASEKAYSKLLGKVGESSQWANNVIEARKTYDGAVDRIGTLIKFTRKVLKRDIYGAAKILRMGVPPGARKKGKSLSGLWLEYHFGWEPLLADIFAGIGALGRDFHSNVLSGGAKNDRLSIVKTTNASTGENTYDQQNTVTSVRQRCRIRVVNPNATLLNDLGLANPVSVVWETIPFSFVVDWFSTAGAVMSAATDFLGIDVLDPYRSYKIQTFRAYRTEKFSPGHAPAKAGGFGNFHGVNAGRALGLVGPTLHFKPFKGFSTTRGATAMALLIQLLPRH